MTQIFLNSLVALLIASAFLATAISALSSEDRSMRKVPAAIRATEVRTQRYKNTDHRS